MQHYRGGPSHIDSFALACKQCNKEKHNNSENNSSASATCGPKIGSTFSPFLSYPIVAITRLLMTHGGLMFLFKLVDLELPCLVEGTLNVQKNNQKEPSTQNNFGFST